MSDAMHKPELMINRRTFLRAAGAAAAVSWMPWPVQAASARGERRLLVLVELKGGNDGFNTLIPYADADYYRLRPGIAIPREQVLPLNERAGLHPELQPLLALWQANELALVQNVGYPQPNLSHFRSIEIWDTASASSEYLNAGWLTRSFSASPLPAGSAADGVVVGGAELGPLVGVSSRAVTLVNPEQFLRQSRLAAPATAASANPALVHVLRVEQAVSGAATRLRADRSFSTVFPNGAFGNAVRTAAQVAAANAGVPVIKLSLNGFDTHVGQSARQARLLKDLAEGLVALKSALVELGQWDSTLVMSYAEFGRRPQQNQSGGTDHGTASVHFVTGGRVRGGFYGAAPDFTRLDSAGNVQHDVDFRALYATVLERWWGMDATGILRGRYAPLDLIRA
jgi:uncharacterized protein (DUF1501 family)